MAMADMARRFAVDGSTGTVTLGDISERQNISLTYLEQLFSRLRKAGLVLSIRGPGGGYRLARPATHIRISDIMRAVEEPVSATRCDDHADSGCMGEERCITHDLWSALNHHIEDFLDSINLADVIDRSVRPGSAGLTTLAHQAAVKIVPPAKESR
jgi:Rrf2 family iron-sulfur cluster assembly transcriptional regulator